MLTAFRARHAARLGAALLLVASGCAPEAEGASPLRLERTLPLPGVEGRIDHLALDPTGKRLAMAALGNGTVEILDLEQGKVVHRLRGLEEPQGVAFLADGRLVVTSGGDGSVRFFAAGTWEAGPRVDLGGDADNMRLEGKSGRLCVGHGAGGIAILERGAKVQDLALAAHPESFQLEALGTRIFVNVPGAGHVAVLDRTPGRATAKWSLGDVRANYPMALDEAHQRLLVGCRSPARLLVLSTADGKRLASVEITGDVDDVWIDAAGERAFLSCGGGAIDVVARSPDGSWKRTARVPTAEGARTSLYDAATKRLYLAVPHRGTQAAEVRVYAVGT